MRAGRQIVILGLMTAALAGVMAAAPGADIEENRKQLRDWEVNNPDEYNRIRRNYDRFRALPEAQRDRLRRFDRELHENPRKAERLGRVLESYAVWFTRLPVDQRERIGAAESTQTKLEIIRELKEREWHDRLPEAYRTQYAAAKSDKDKQDLVRKWKQQQREFEDSWTETHLMWGGLQNRRQMLPLAQEAFRKDLFTFVRDRLYPMLDVPERARLEQAEQEYEKRGSPVPWLRAVAELSERHPLLSLERKYATHGSLPAEYQQALGKLPKFALRFLPENRWPQYPIEVTRALRKAGAQPKQQLGPTNAREISERVDAWLQKEIWPRLSDSDKRKLKDAEGKWPDYPQALHDVAKSQRVAIPELTLPGDPRMWDMFRQRPTMPPGPGRKGP